MSNIEPGMLKEEGILAQGKCAVTSACRTGGALGMMAGMKLVSWNVNGIRAALKAGFLDFMGEAKADILCLQEIKAQPDQVAEVVWPKGYEVFWNPAQKKGYSGTAVFTRETPLSVTHGLSGEEDVEGRVLTLEYPDFFLVNVYTPNSQRGLTRLEYRTQQWDPAFLKHVKRLQRRKPVVFCGDLNVAHQEIDLANPRSNKRNAGFTIEERTTFGQLLEEAKLVDTFREFEPGPGHYSWWSYMGRAREKNVGWRIDYFGISQKLRDRLKSAFIWPHVRGSDHCPVGVELQ